MKYKIMLLVAFSMALIELHAQTYNYGVDVCNQDAKIEGKLNISDSGESVLIGANAGLNDNGALGNRNVAIGNFAAQFNVMGKENVIMGYEAGRFGEKNRNVLIGSEAGKDNPLEDNVMIGFKTGQKATGFKNVLIGNSAGYQSGNLNTYVGNGSGNINIGTRNTFMGWNSGQQTINANKNTFIGSSAGSSALKDNNTFIGSSAGAQSANGQENVFVGIAAGGFVSGNMNVCVGNRAGQSAAIDDGNVFLGFDTGLNASGSNQLYISNTASDTLIWGDFANDKVEINGDLQINGDVYYGSICAPSDRRFKKNIKLIPNALEDLLKINGVVHEWKNEEFPDKNWGQGKVYGVIAQELEQVFPELVMKDKAGYRLVDYSKLTPILIESVKTQQAVISSQTETLDRLKLQVAELGDVEHSLKELEALISISQRINAEHPKNSDQ